MLFINWDALGAIAELLGALAVVLTLAYLATQVRQNSKGVNVAAKQEMTRQFSGVCNMPLGDDKLSEIHDKGINDEELTTIEKRKFNLFMLKGFWYFSSMHFQYEANSLDDGDWIQSESMIKNHCRLLGVKK